MQILPNGNTLIALNSAQSRAATEGVILRVFLAKNDIDPRHGVHPQGYRQRDGHPLDASVNHIVRYYNKASGRKWLQRELFVILNHMKDKCAYYPMLG